MHYEYRVVINATNGNEQRAFTYLSKDGKPITDYKDALAIREKMTQSIDAQGFSPLSTVIQSRRVEDWGRTTYPAALGLDTGKLINDNQLMAQRLDAIEAQCVRERANIDNIKPAARNADFLLGELSNFTRHIHLTADAEGGVVAFYAGHPEYNAEFVAELVAVKSRLMTVRDHIDRTYGCPEEKDWYGDLSAREVIKAIDHALKGSEW